MAIASGPLSDPHALSLRRESLRTGVWPTLFVCLFTAAYVAMSWSEPHRLVIAALIGLTVVASITVSRAPLDGILRSRWREPFFLGYSATLTGCVTTAILVDGASASPMMPLLFLPLVYAAVSYPVLPMLLVALMDLTAFLVVASMSQTPAPMHMFMFASSLATAAWICAWLSNDHEQHRNELARASRTDPLTGCLNRRGFSEAFDDETGRAGRLGVGLTLILIDLDDFKAVNDEHGHAAGDELLRWVADRLHAEFRAHDVVARLGGDEFAVLTYAEPETATERILAAFARRAPACVGAARFPTDGHELDALSRVADSVLYACKHARPRGSRALAA